MKQTLFIFLRHAESEKNIIDIIGGKGKQLTVLGVQQAETIADLLYQMLGTKQCDIISSPAVQACETASIIAKQFDKDVIVSDELVPASMGIISGLSENEIQDRFPDIAETLRKWRSCEIEACDILVPGKEAPEIFWNRMIDFLNSHATGKIKIIVATRSIMVFAKNLVQNKLPQKGGGYKHMNVAHCEIVSFIWNEGICAN